MEKFKTILEMVCTVLETLAMIVASGFVIWFIWQLMSLLISFD